MMRNSRTYKKKEKKTKKKEEKSKERKKFTFAWSLSHALMRKRKEISTKKRENLCYDTHMMHGMHE